MNVKYTNQISDNYFQVVIPLKYGSKMWFFIDPLSFHVWLCSILCVPIYLLAMGLADYLFNGYADWGAVTDDFNFVIRNALSEQNYAPRDKRVYQKILIVIWSWSMLVLVQSYAGNLTAMLTRPKLQEPIKTLEDLFSQDKVSWIIPDNTIIPTMKMSKNGSALKRLHDGGIIIPPNAAWDCFPLEIYQDGTFGSICNMGSIQMLMNNDYSSTGKCNYYTIEDKFLSSGGSMAFQVGISCNIFGGVQLNKSHLLSDGESLPG